MERRFMPDQTFGSRPRPAEPVRAESAELIPRRWRDRNSPIPDLPSALGLVTDEPLPTAANDSRTAAMPSRRDARHQGGGGRSWGGRCVNEI
jgi:hypothetical protein